MPTNKPDLIRAVGLDPETGTIPPADRSALHRIISVKLAAQGFDVPVSGDEEDGGILNLASDLFRVYREQSRLLDSHLCPIDQRIQDFLNDILPAEEAVSLPTETVTVDRYGLARELSFPQNGDEFKNSEISSYRLSKNGVLHNPLNDKRTTKGGELIDRGIRSYPCSSISNSLFLS